MGQEDLAKIAGMSQPNVSKALSDTNKKQFNLDQLFRIAQHFGISIDELVGNTTANVASTYRKGKLPEEPFKMVLNGYLEQLSDK